VAARAPASKLPSVASPSLAPKAPRGAVVATGKRPAAPKAQASGNGRVPGVALELGNSADAHDAEFERY
jgi:hypothetical protein